MSDDILSCVPVIGIDQLAHLPLPESVPLYDRRDGRNDRIGDVRNLRWVDGTLRGDFHVAKREAPSE